MSLIAEFELGSPLMGETAGAVPSMEFRTEDMRLEPDPRFVFWATGDDYDRMESAMQTDPHVADATLLTELADRRLYRVTLADCALEALTYPAAVESDIVFLDVTATDGTSHVRARAPSRGALEAYRAACSEREIPFELLGVYEEGDAPGRGAHGQRVRQVLEAAPVSVIVVEPSGEISFANSRAEQLLGVPREEITDRSYDHADWTLFSEDGSPITLEDHPVTRALETGEAVYEFTHWIERGDGNRRWLSTNCAPVVDEAGTVEYVVVGFEDVTAMKRRERQLERLRRLTGVIRTVKRAVARARSREELAEAVCASLLEFEEYRFSAVGTFSASMESFDLWARAGDPDGYLEQALNAASGPPLSEGLAGTAQRSGELQVAQDLGELPGEYWQEVASAHGVRSYASIPLVHDSTVYGVIGLFADSADAFDERQRAVLAELGEVTGYALSALERKAVLDPTTEMTFRTDPSATIELDEAVAGELTYESTVSLPDGKLLRYWTVTGLSLAVVRTIVDETPGVTDMRVLSSTEDSARVEIVVDETSPSARLERLGGSLQSVTIEDGRALFRAQFDRARDTDAVLETLREAYPAIELVSQRTVLTERYYREMVDTSLTDRQATVLKLAHFSGYFDRPREQTGEELAEKLDITRQTFNDHLRKAQFQVFEHVLKRTQSDTD